MQTSLLIMGTRASWGTPACWPGGVRSKAGRSWEHAHPLLPSHLELVSLHPGSKNTGVAQLPFPSPAQSLPKAASAEDKTHRSTVCAPASHRADLAIHQGLPGSREHTGWMYSVQRPHQSGPCQSALKDKTLLQLPQPTLPSVLSQTPQQKLPPTNSKVPLYSAETIFNTL